MRSVTFEKTLPERDSSQQPLATRRLHGSSTGPGRHTDTQTHHMTRGTRGDRADARGHLDVADGLGGRDEEADDDGEEVLGREAEGIERLRPQEGDVVRVLQEIFAVVRLLHPVAIDVLARGSHAAAEGEAPKEEGGFEEGGAERLDEERDKDHREREAHVLRRAEAERHFAVVVEAQLWPDCAEGVGRVAQEAIALGLTETGRRDAGGGAGLCVLSAEDAALRWMLVGAG